MQDDLTERLTLEELEAAAVEAAKLLHIESVDPERNPVYESVSKLEGSFLDAAGLAGMTDLNAQLTYAGMQLGPVVRTVRQALAEQSESDSAVVGRGSALRFTVEEAKQLQAAARWIALEIAGRDKGENPIDEATGKALDLAIEALLRLAGSPWDKGPDA